MYQNFLVLPNFGQFIYFDPNITTYKCFNHLDHIPIFDTNNLLGTENVAKK